LLESPEKVISTILVGNNIVNILAAAIATSIAITKLKADIAVGVATGVMTFLTLVFGDITPKTFAIRHAEEISLIVVKPLTLFSYILMPVVFLVNKISLFFVSLVGGKKVDHTPTITEQELITMVNVSHEEGVIEVEEREMIHNVFEFGDREIREIMTPRVLVVTIDADDDYNTVISLFKEHTYSRMPVCESDSDDIIGILHIKDIAFEDIDKSNFHVKDYYRTPNFVYEFNNTAKVFNEMRKNSVSMSVVLDEYGVMAGVVTAKDFIEEIIGDITDEYDDEEDLIKEVAENEYLVDGTVAIDRFNDFVNAEIESDEFESIGGFVLGILEELPDVGEKITYEDIDFIVESITNNRIESLRVKIKPEKNKNVEKIKNGEKDKIGERDKNAERVKGGEKAEDAV
jgi:putative hemolysin